MKDEIPAWLNNIEQFYFDLGDKQTQKLFQAMELLLNSSKESNVVSLINDSKKIISESRCTAYFFKNFRSILLPAVLPGVSEWVNSQDSKMHSDKKIKFLKILTEQILKNIEGEDESSLCIARQELISVFDKVKQLNIS